MRTEALRKADVLAPERSELETVRLFGGETQLNGSPLKERDCPLELDAGILLLCAIVNEVSVRTAVPKRCAVFSNRVDRDKGGCAQYSGTRNPTSFRKLLATCAVTPNVDET